jgi:hypothetical protein
VAWSQVRTPPEDAESEEAASVLLRCTVRDPDRAVVDRAFTGAVVELALASYPGFTMTAPPGKASPYGVYRAEYVERSLVAHTVHHADGSREVVPDPPIETGNRPSPGTGDVPQGSETAITMRAPLGTFVHARSGDKGGDANLGLWVRTGERQRERASWLLDFVTEQQVRALVPEAADLEVTITALPRLCGVNVVVHGLLGEGVAASTRFDPQAKGLGEWVRSRVVSIPEELL